MKIKVFNASVFLMALLYLSHVNAQDKSNSSEFRTLLSDDIEHGGYGAFSVGYTQVGDYNAFSGGGKGAWLINHRIGIGLAGNGFMTEKLPSVFQNENSAYIMGGYGGFLIEPIFYANRPVHFAIPIIIGGGGITYREGYMHDPDNIYYPDIYDTFFVFEPGIELELNMVKFFRIALGVSYRFTSDIDLSANIEGEKIPLLDKNSMNKIVTKIIFKFGKF